MTAAQASSTGSRSDLRNGPARRADRVGPLARRKRCATPDQSGTYTVTVNNYYYGWGGTNSVTIPLTITEELPGTPEDVQATNTDGDVNVSFSPSQTSGAGEADTFDVTLGDSLSTTVSGYSADFAAVAPGTYPITVTATNTAGSSEAATGSVYVTAATRPSAPRNITTTEFKNKSVLWDWEAPADNGGGEILAYDAMITFPDGDGSFEGTDGNGGGYVDLDPDLREWATYDLPTDQGEFIITMYARNEAGTSIAGVSAKTAVPTSGIPSAPLNVVATSPYENMVTVTFDTPATDGGLAVEGYRITVNGVEDYVSVPADRSVTFYDVPAGSYTASVDAYNNNQDEMGYSPAGTSASVTVIDYVGPPVVHPPIMRAPSPPRNVAVASGKGGKAIVTFMAPRYLHHGAITRYIVKIAGQRTLVDGSVHTVKFRGLTKGTYKVKVHARNKAGRSKANTERVVMSRAKAAAKPITLKLGMLGWDVRQLQVRLLPTKHHKGEFDAATRAAVLRWRRSHHKALTGVVNASMRSALHI